MRYAMAVGALGLVTVYAALGAGCGGADVKGACLDACNTLASCNGGDSKDQDCSASCDKLADSVDGTGCESDATALYDCVNDAGCSVDVEKDCKSEIADVQTCAIQFCVDNPKDERCSGSSSNSGSGPNG